MLYHGVYSQAHISALSIVTWLGHFMEHSPLPTVYSQHPTHTAVFMLKSRNRGRAQGRGHRSQTGIFETDCMFPSATWVLRCRDTCQTCLFKNRILVSQQYLSADSEVLWKIHTHGWGIKAKTIENVYRCKYTMINHNQIYIINAKHQS